VRRRASKPAVPSGPRSPAARRGGLFGRVIPQRPPREVLDAIERAARRYDELRAEGHELHVAPEEGGRVTVELHDCDGQVLDTLAPSELLDIAQGAPLPER
jgi:hypothetical protein